MEKSVLAIPFAHPYFHFGVMHPVVRALSRLSEKPSFATIVQGVIVLILRGLHVLALTGHHQAEHTI
jgi:hypothetical protein